MVVITKGTYMFGEHKVTVFAKKKSHKLQINTLDSQIKLILFARGLELAVF